MVDSKSNWCQWSCWKQNPALNTIHYTKMTFERMMNDGCFKFILYKTNSLCQKVVILSRNSASNVWYCSRFLRCFSIGQTPNCVLFCLFFSFVFFFRFCFFLFCMWNSLIINKRKANCVRMNGLLSTISRINFMFCRGLSLQLAGMAGLRKVQNWPCKLFFLLHFYLWWCRNLGSDRPGELYCLRSPV